MPEDIFTIDVDAIDVPVESETSRFRTALRHHLAARGTIRRQLRNDLVEALRLSTQTAVLIQQLVEDCLSLGEPERFDVAIDVLSQLDRSIYDYASRFASDDRQRWQQRHPDREYEPNADTMYVLMRSVAQSTTPEDARLQFIALFDDSTNRGVLEAVVESLRDIDSTAARDRLEKLGAHDDPFIAELADDLLSQD